MAEESEPTLLEMLVGCVILVCIIYFIMGLFETNRDFYDKSVIKKFLNIPRLTYHQEEDPIIDGNLLIVDKAKASLDRYYWKNKEATESLPEDPEEIDYVLWVDCKEKKVGVYDDGIDALQEFCTLSLIDLYLNNIIDKKEITGPFPQSKKVKGRTYSAKGGHPFSKIEKYVKSITPE